MYSRLRNFYSDSLCPGARSCERRARAGAASAAPRRARAARRSDLQFAVQLRPGPRRVARAPGRCSVAAASARVKARGCGKGGVNDRPFVTQMSQLFCIYTTSTSRVAYFAGTDYCMQPNADRTGHARCTQPFLEKRAPRSIPELVGPCRASQADARPLCFMVLASCSRSRRHRGGQAATTTL